MHPAAAGGGDADQHPPGIDMAEFFNMPGYVGYEPLQFKGQIQCGHMA
jgi:hypothetical protein